MLIRFSVENFMSYKERQVFSMVAGRSEAHKSHIVERGGHRILKGSFFFGANASGKSNLFKAIEFAGEMVQNGTRKGRMLKKYFRIDSAFAKKPGVFQFDIYANGHFYSYGFALSYLDSKIVGEWLYLCDGDEIKIFERSEKNIETDYRFLTEDNERKFYLYAEDIPDEKFFLSEIAERKLAEYSDFSPYREVSNWFHRLVFITPETQYRNSSEDISSMLSDFDTGIESVIKQKKNREDVLEYIPEDVIDRIENLLQTVKKITMALGEHQFEFFKEENDIVVYELGMNHGNKDDLFQLSDESDGTQRLFDLIPIYQAAKSPFVFLVDELDRSFHTILVQRYIRQFYQSTRDCESQLIATVHDAHVMDLDLLRQDEIWFVERKADHSSHIYSLNRFVDREDADVVKDYLLGRYGAIPCLMQTEEESE